MESSLGWRGKEEEKSEREMEGIGKILGGISRIFVSF